MHGSPLRPCSIALVCARSHARLLSFAAEPNMRDFFFLVQPAPSHRVSCTLSSSVSPVDLASYCLPPSAAQPLAAKWRFIEAVVSSVLRGRGGACKARRGGLNPILINCFRITHPSLLLCSPSLPRWSLTLAGFQKSVLGVVLIIIAALVAASQAEARRLWTQGHAFVLCYSILLK